MTLVSRRLLGFPSLYNGGERTMVLESLGAAQLIVVHISERQVGAGGRE